MIIIKFHLWDSPSLRRDRHRAVVVDVHDGADGANSTNMADTSSVTGSERGRSRERERGRSFEPSDSVRKGASATAGENGLEMEMPLPMTNPGDLAQKHQQHHHDHYRRRRRNPSASRTPDQRLFLRMCSRLTLLQKIGA